MGKLFCFERACYRADGYTRFGCACCRVEVGCVFNFESFLLPVGCTLGCHRKIHFSQKMSIAFRAYMSPAERAKLALIGQPPFASPLSPGSLQEV